MVYITKALPNSKRMYISTKWIEGMVLGNPKEPRVSMWTVSGRVYHAVFSTQEEAEEFVRKWLEIDKGLETPMQEVEQDIENPEIQEITDEPEVTPGERNG
jgi:hypothetical protein